MLEENKDAILTGDRGLYHLVKIKFQNPEQSIHTELKKVSKKIKYWLALRKFYQSKKFNCIESVENQIIKYSENSLNYNKNKIENELKSEEVEFEFEEGILKLYDQNKKLVYSPLSRETFQRDLNHLFTFCSSGSANTFSNTRLQILRQLFELYKTLCWRLEFFDLKKNSPDFESVPKVDNHIHVAAAMPASFLLNYLKQKMSTEPQTIVLKQGNRTVTLKDFFGRGNLNHGNLNFNKLFDQAPKETFKRFDVFLDKYNIFGFEDGRRIFLKYDNFVKGRFLGEMLSQLIDTAAEHNIFLEYHISVYGNSEEEFDKLANFVVENNLLKKNVKWIVQIPRTFERRDCSRVDSKGKEKINKHSFEKFILNIFKRIYEATKNPELHPVLTKFLEHVVAFDSVDDESEFDKISIPTKFHPSKVFPYNFSLDTKAEVANILKSHSEVPSSEENEKTFGKEEAIYKGKIPYSYYLYYLWANLSSINFLRKLKGLNTFALRPHAGEAGEIHHLATSFLLCDSINHGIKLKESPSLTYLFYLSQLGCSISPTSNNYLFETLKNNPFTDFFKIGLNVTLSTDDPLLFHMTQNPLLEEYAVMREYFKFSDCDLLEIAKNSVKQSGFSRERKMELLGKGFEKDSYASNDMNVNGLSDCRARYRENNLFSELFFIKIASEKKKFPTLTCYGNDNENEDGLDEDGRKMETVEANYLFIFINSFDELKASQHYETFVENVRKIKENDREGEFDNVEILDKFEKNEKCLYLRKIKGNIILANYKGSSYFVNDNIGVRKIEFDFN